MCRIGRRPEQMHGLHQAIEVRQGHHDRVIGMMAGDHRIVCIGGDAIQNLFEVVAGIGERDGLHVGHPLFVAWYDTVRLTD